MVMKKRMKKITKIAIVSTAALLLSILAWKLSENKNPSVPLVPNGVALVWSGVITILSWITVILSKIAERRTKPVNTCVLLGVINLLTLATAISYGVYDIKTDTDIFLQGIRGTLILLFVVPFLAVLLIVDIIVYFMKRKRSGKETVS